MSDTILHIIDSLKVGGAETLLVGTVTAMPEYQHIIVTLQPGNDFEEKMRGYEIYCLNYRSKLDLLRSIRVLKSIIKRNRVVLIHSHLLTATFLARLSRTNNIPLIFSVHNKLSESAFKHSTMSKWLESLFYSKSHFALFVSDSVKQDYDRVIGIRGESIVLHNFIEDKFFTTESTFEPPNETLKLVSVGSLKPQKNYRFLIEAFRHINDCSLDIIGEGPQKIELLELIESHNLLSRVRLIGKISNVEQLLPNYDLFVMASTYEGFGIAPVEAMALGLPVLVSDIPVFREVTDDCVQYFDPYDQQDFILKLSSLKSSPEQLALLSTQGKQHAYKLGRKDSYVNKLSKLYTQLCL